MSSTSHIPISGYLHKMTRDGRWQKRWFETNGNFLTYYKSKKMTKLLAALNLPQVGAISLVGKSESIDSVDVNDGGLFTIELNERVYTLKAEGEEEARRWVTKLNGLKDTGIVEEVREGTAEVEKTKRSVCMPCCTA